MPLSSGVRMPGDPHLRRWMMFVDGENFTIRAQDLAEAKHFGLVEGAWFDRDVFVWTPEQTGTLAITNIEKVRLKVQDHSIRSYYYTTVTGDDVKVREIEHKIHEAGFSPKVFKKDNKDRSTKGVDISLATDMLGNAYNNNYDVAVLVAGDGDYVPLVEDVKRLGKVVYVAFFLDDDSGMNDNLLLASDHTFDAERAFRQAWINYVATD